MQFQLSGREMFYFNPELGEGDQVEEGDEALNLYITEEDGETNDEQVTHRLTTKMSFLVLILIYMWRRGRILH